MKKKILIRILSVVLLYSSLMTQSIESDNIRFNFDYARFKAADDWSYLEIYLSFPRNSLHYSETEEKLAASYQIAMDLYNEDSLVHTKTRQLTDAVDSLSEVKKGEYIVDIYALYLPPGRYRCITTIKYLFSGIQGSTECEIKIDSFKSDMIKISDIQLGYHIVSQKKAGQFVKNGYYILPNPSGVYGLKWPNLYYYAEIYNLSSLQADQDSTYTVSVCIKDDAGTIIKEMPKKQKIRRGASIAEVGRINVGSLFSGPYQLQVTVIDNAKNDSISKKNHFFVYKSADYASSHTDVSYKEETANEFSEWSEHELDKHFDMVRYIASGYEKKVYSTLDREGKQQFLVSFWKKRDTVPETVSNEFKQEYLQRVMIANERYTAGVKEGWRTDQGRIFIIYGKPDQVDRYHGGLSQYPYQIWHYYRVEGKVEFIFVDTAGYGIMRLVHSTAKNEVHDYDWQSRWRK